MKLLLERIAYRQSYTIGKIYINGKYFCDSLEDADRGLDDQMDVEEILRKKVAGITAIPTGTYNVNMDIISPRFRGRKQYRFCDGKLPRLENVKGYEGVLIHIGNTANDSSGCILVGVNNVVGKVTQSTKTFMELYAKMEIAHHKNEKITITVKNK